MRSWTHLGEILEKFRLAKHPPNQSIAWQRRGRRGRCSRQSVPSLPEQDRSKSIEPSRHPGSGLCVGHHSPFKNRFLTFRDAFKKLDSRLHQFISRDIHEICGGQTVLRDQKRFAGRRDFRNQFRGLSFQRSNELRPHESDTKISLGCHKRFLCRTNETIRPRHGCPNQPRTLSRSDAA